MQLSIYQQKGYNNREHYLLKMSENYQVPLDFVKKVADIIGRDRDFDGLEDLLFLCWKTVREELGRREGYREAMERLKRQYGC